MAVCTSSDVFQFVGAPADVQATQGSQVTALIANAVSHIEEMIGRKIEPTSFSGVIFHNGLNCTISGDKLFLKSKYRDIYAISEIKECNEILTPVTGYNSGGDYFLDTLNGIIVRENANWSRSNFAITISGTLGVGLGTTPRVLKQAVIEIVAAKSGLWKQNVITEGGTIESLRTTPSPLTMDAIKQFMAREF